jgi:Flp pilus assembly protein TadG
MIVGIGQMPLKRSWKCESGNIMLVFAISLSGLVLMAGLALDTTRVMGVRAALQSATDAAALEAAVALRDSPRSYARRGEQVFANNVSKQGWDGTPSIVLSAEADRVSATARATAKTLFMSAFGSDLVEMTTHAVATTTSGPPICTLGMSNNLQHTIQWLSRADFETFNCVVHSNSTHASALHIQGLARADATDFCAVGGVGGNVNRFVKQPRTNCTPIADPTFAVPGDPGGPCASTSIVPQDTTMTLSPGRYCNGLEISGEVTFQPGIYSFHDRPLIIKDQAVVNGDEVLLHFWGPSATFTISNQAGVRLTAPKTGLYNGLLMTHEPGGVARLAEFKDNSQVELTGALYLPSFNIVYSNNARFGLTTDYVAVIVNTVVYKDNSVVRMSAQPVLAGYDDRLPRAFYMPRLLN